VTTDLFSFRPTVDFRPLPLLRNRHVQTLLGHLLRGPAFRHPTQARILWLPDGDGLVLHDSVPPGWREGDGVAVLVHGLAGSHESGHVQRLAGLLLPRGLRVVRMDQRGCGKGLPLARGCYHGGRSEDVRAVLEEVHRWSPSSPLTLIGISLGGNLVLKAAGEAAERPVAGLARVAALAPPIDMERCASLLALSRNRLYEQFFLRELMGQARQRHRYFPDRPLRFPRKMTIRLYDELYTAPRGGFEDALDYYRRSSSFPLVGRIQIPTLILTARDDPFIAVEPFEELQPPPHVTIRIAEHGGHLGFLGSDGAGGIRWAERRVAEWVLGD
jgi:predicted alpha/beta-fold hydrolase